MQRTTVARIGVLIALLGVVAALGVLLSELRRLQRDLRIPKTEAGRIHGVVVRL